MRYLAIILSVWLIPVQVEAQSRGLGTDSTERWRKGEEDEAYGKELARERYETALARERAQQAYFNHQAQMYEYQRSQQDLSLHRAEQERRYDERTEDITNVNQVANTITSVVRQIQALSGGQGGW